MKNGTDDRRVKYTKAALKESFIHLLEKKDISKITIKEICANADINRATFYAHYSDQYDLMRKIEDELLDNISDYLYEYTHKDPAKIDTVRMVERIFEYIKENARLCKLLLSERGDLHFQKKIMMLIYEKNIDYLTSGGFISKEEAEFIYSYTITGCVGVIQRWLDDDMPQSTRLMAEVLVKLTNALTIPFMSKSKS